MFQADKSLILAKIEAQYGTDPVPAEATESIIVLGLPEYTPLGSMRERAVPLNFYGKLKGVNVGDGLKITFKTELKASGTAGTVSRYDPLFRACNMTVSGTSTKIYTPNSTMDAESCTIYFYRGGVLHKLIGCRGTFSMSLVAGEIAVINWEFTGLYADNAADIATPSPTFEAIAPVIVQSLGLTYNSVSVVIKELMLDIGNSINARKDCNAANNGVSQYVVTGREAKGSMKIEALALSALNPWDIWDNTTAANIALDITATAGYDFSMAVTGVVLNEIPKYGDENNILTWDLGFSINPTAAAGNNEIIITFK